MKIKTIFSCKKYYFLLFLLGAISSLGFAPLNLFFLTIISYSIAVSLTLKTKKKNTAFFYGASFGVAHHFCSLYWISISFEFAKAGGYFTGLIAVLFLSLFFSIFTATAFYFIGKLKYNDKSRIFSNAIAIILILTSMDWIKGNIFWSFPWLPISAIWTFSTLTLFPFSLLGKWGYSLVTFSLIIALLLANKNPKYSFILLCPFFLILSFFYLSQMPNKSNPKKINVRLVQPNISQSEKWKPEKAKENFQKLINLSIKKGYQETDLIIWPETSLNFDFNSEEENFIAFKEFIKQSNNVIAGAIRKEYVNKKLHIYNSLYLFNGKNEEIQKHDKVKLVPFGEFIPFKNFFNLNKLTQGNLDFSKGTSINPLVVENKFNILPLICYEIIFSNLVAKDKQYNFLVNITNDGWYGQSFGPYQHLALSKIRAVEEGRVVLRVANTGISAVINYDGKILSSLKLDEKGIIDKKVILLKKNTLYKKIGDNLFYGLISVLCFYLLITYRTLW